MRRRTRQKGGGKSHANLIRLSLAFSGACALGAEVVWTRLLALLFGPTVYTFSLILAVVLIGIGIGSLLGAVRAGRTTNAARDLGCCQLILAAACAWAAVMIDRSLPYWPIAPSLSLSPWFNFQLDVTRTMWAVLPASLLFGASFPLSIAALSGPREDPGHVVAGLYAANTIGAIAGALVFSFIIVPAQGSRFAQAALVACACLGAAFAFAASRVGAPPRAILARLAQGVATIGICMLAIQAVPPVPGDLIAFGRSLAFRLGARDPKTGGHVPLPSLLYVGEGANESVAVSQADEVRVFHVSGKNEASTSPKDMRLQLMLGHLPALLHRNPESVLIVGFGAGVTAGTFVNHPSIKRIVICEIEPLIPQHVGPLFAAENNGVVSDPRVEIVYDDARHYMLTSHERFDIITSDPIHPWVRGSAALYSRDYFALVRRHLTAGGLVSQWLPLYQGSEATIRGELATFFSVFPGGSIWANEDRGQGYDLTLLGGDGPTAVDLNVVSSRLGSPDFAPVARALAAVGLRSWYDVMSTYAGREHDLASWLRGARLNDDRTLWLQYQAGMESYVEQGADIYGRIRELRAFPEDLFSGSESLRRELRDGPGPAPPAASRGGSDRTR